MPADKEQSDEWKRERGYRGRLAPSPTGYLHVGHARTFWVAQERARAAKGSLILRNEDLDSARCKAEFVDAMLEDMRWFGLNWDEGPDCGGGFGPYSQSARREFYVLALERLAAGRFIYPCWCSRGDVQRALQAPHQGEEPIYPGTCRPKDGDLTGYVAGRADRFIERASEGGVSRRCHWRFKVPADEIVEFGDGFFGRQRFVCGKDFGDFVVWRQDDVPAYQLAVVVDDALMQVTEVVRGADLLMSTARQILLYRALGWEQPAFFHCPLMTDRAGVRLAKRHDALSLRSLRGQGATPEQLRKDWTIQADATAMSQWVTRTRPQTTRIKPAKNG